MPDPRSVPLASLLRARPLAVLLAAIALATSLYVVCYPLWVTELPPMTDVPFHATAISIFRHYWDPSYGFREQFTIHPLEVPYVSMYVVGALFALFMPIAQATKASAIVMLGLLPAGLAVMFHGMKKTPLWGLLGLAVVWTNLTWWGFLNHMGALGLFAMSVGFALLSVDEPTRMRRWGLALSLLGVFFTHVFRFPFALLAVVAAAVCVYPSTRRIRPILLPLLPALAVFVAWRMLRPADIGAEGMQLGFASERFSEASSHLIQNFHGANAALEQELFEDLAGAIAVVTSTSLFWFFWTRRHRPWSARRVWWAIGVTALPLVLAGGFLFAYLTLPMNIGRWWYVYPRELTSALFIALAVAPDMPREAWLRVPLVGILAVFLGRVGLFAATEAHRFEESTADFRAVVEQVPKAPKLLYLVFDHGGSARKSTPFIHLPAWVQAEKGGALSFHFVAWNLYPIRYRTDSEHVPPPVPHRWEWTPQAYRHRTHGAWFDEFLIRHRRDPSALFKGDASITLAAHQGSWWLFRRQR